MGKYFTESIMPKDLEDSNLMEIANSLCNAVREKALSTTYFWRIGCSYSYGWYITAGWQGGYDPDEGGCTDRLCMKIAYISEHSMLMEYDYDFLMPYDDKTGGVWDTETSLSSSPVAFSVYNDLQWMMKEFNKMVKESRESLKEAA